jgi:hypothetical protein
MSEFFSWWKFNDLNMMIILKLKISQVSDVAAKEIQEPMADEVITSEHGLSLCLFVECLLLTNVQYICLLW